MPEVVIIDDGEGIVELLLEVSADGALELQFDAQTLDLGDGGPVLGEEMGRVELADGEPLGAEVALGVGGVLRPVRFAPAHYSPPCSELPFLAAHVATWR